MVYAIEEMKIAAAGFAACGGTYGKGKREKAVLSKKPEGTFLTSCCAGRDASLPAQTVVIMAAAPGFAIARALCARGALSAKREEVPLGCNLGKALTPCTGHR